MLIENFLSNYPENKPKARGLYLVVVLKPDGFQYEAWREYDGEKWIADEEGEKVLQFMRNIFTESGCFKDFYRE